MNATARIILRSALYTVLLCSPPMLSADGGDEARPDNMQPTPKHLAGPAIATQSLLRLGDKQLDSIVAGQTSIQDPGDPIIVYDIRAAVPDGPIIEAAGVITF
jgi:hypothetical protein